MKLTDMFLFSISLIFRNTLLSSLPLLISCLKHWLLSFLSGIKAG